MDVSIDEATEVRDVYSCLEVKYKDILYIKRLVIPEGKIVSLVGPSGSGKTTALKLFNRMITPDSGCIYFRGDNIDKLDPVRLRRSAVMLPQNPLIFPGSIRDNLLIGSYYSDKKRPGNDELERLLAEFKVTKDLAADTAKLSGGEKQRLSLARIILMDPDVLLLDEPSSSLDDYTEELIIDYITNFSKARRKTLIMVTHSKTVAKKYSDLIVIIEDGQISNWEKSIV